MDKIINIEALIRALQETDWLQVLLALIAGMILGYIFIKLKLPAPAPLVIAGIAGIVGIWLGYVLGGK